ncbi:transmembrane protein, putative (macronuclear) [Tetrahymena thermophila SB210]|uniref:Transmembrane protein, putative n=1 Tax=Tetrahymena thermophila (strain SB210) TaxID=312017 RepID=W7XFE0_TETTS|nr:transmembrane protein, putative [Tetrahymena thermophila SB210]EWS75548.1 transmembrane protein, putative [Tetrahymena thermophila SB210]|eukprot:XP_012651914.1 transmembrane protein, putative [Tetrahymena thermophila SB210]
MKIKNNKKTPIIKTLKIKRKLKRKQIKKRNREDPAALLQAAAAVAAVMMIALVAEVAAQVDKALKVELNRKKNEIKKNKKNKPKKNKRKIKKKLKKLKKKRKKRKKRRKVKVRRKRRIKNPKMKKMKKIEIFYQNNSKKQNINLLKYIKIYSKNQLFNSSSFQLLYLILSFINCCVNHLIIFIKIILALHLIIFSQKFQANYIINLNFLFIYKISFLNCQNLIDNHFQKIVLYYTIQFLLQNKLKYNYIFLNFIKNQIFRFFETKIEFDNLNTYYIQYFYKILFILICLFSKQTKEFNMKNYINKFKIKKLKKSAKLRE